MAEQLKPLNVAAPGFMGLNTQDASTTLPPSYALVADNCVIDAYGRIGARKGWTPVNATNATLGSANITALHEYVKPDGSLVQISIGNKNIFTGTSTLTSIYSDATWTNENWKVVSFNGKALFFQRGNDPLAYDGTTIKKLVDFNTAWVASKAYTTNTLVVPTTSNGYYYICTVAGTSAATQPTWPTTPQATVTDGGVTWKCLQIPQANEVLAAYGRIWVADTTSDKVTVSWSDLLIPQAFAAGSSGTLNIEVIQSNGTDPITALAAFNGFLLIFTANSTIIYQGAKDPSTMSLYDVIYGVGCIARDTVKDIGADLLFLSKNGVQSFNRVVQEKSLPVNNLSRNVRDQLLKELATVSSLDTVKSVHYPQEAMYLLTIPSQNKTYCFDLREKLQDGSLKVTTWSGATSTAFCVNRAGQLLMGKPGYIGWYNKYTDNGSSYVINYYTNYMDGGDITVLKMLKKMGVVIYGGAGAKVRFLWNVDYNYQTLSTVNTTNLPQVSEYNIAEYNIAEYGSSLITRLTQNLGGSGKVFQIGIEVTLAATTNAIYGMSIQQLDIFFKGGREI